MTPTQSMATKQHIFDRGKAELEEWSLRRPRLRALWPHDEEGRGHLWKGARAGLW